MAESMEERDLIKRNPHAVVDGRAQNRNTITSGLMRVREIARRDRHAQFTSLLHHLDENHLIRSFNSLQRSSAAGADGVSWHYFEKNLAENVRSLKEEKKVNWVLDLDISKFFDRVNHDWLIRFLEHRIRDKRIIRLIRKWLKVGHYEDSGRRIKSQIGTPQGAVISPYGSVWTRTS